MNAKDDPFSARHSIFNDDVRIQTWQKPDGGWTTELDVKRKTLVYYGASSRKKAAQNHRSCLRDAGPYIAHYANSVVRTHRAVEGMEIIGEDDAVGSSAVYITVCGSVLHKDSEIGGAVTCLTCIGTAAYGPESEW